MYLPRLSTFLLLSSLAIAACDHTAEPDDLRSATDTGTTDGTTGITGTSDLPADTVWNVYDDTDAYVGELATPDAGAFADHSDMFAPGQPRTAFLTTPDNFGFLLVTAGTAFYGPEHDSMMFTGENCTGTPIDFFATYADKPETSIVVEDCNLAGASLPGVVPHYTFTTEWLEQHWPGADGLLMPRVDGSEWYTLSFDQPWPSQRVTSVR